MERHSSLLALVYGLQPLVGHGVAVFTVLAAILSALIKDTNN